MSASYPFFSIARERQVPYGDVLAIQAQIADNPLRLEYWSSDEGLYGEIARAELAERRRCQQVEKELKQIA